MSEESQVGDRPTDEARQGRTRPGGRSSRVRAAVLGAALEVITEAGPGLASLSEIARRAGVHASSIQRRWGSVHTVLLDAILGYSEQHVPIPDTGSLRGDLIAMAQLVCDYLASPQGATLARVMAANEDSPSTARMRDVFWASRHEAAAVVMRRAVERGEVRAGVDATLVLELLIGPIHFRHLLTRQTTEPELLERTVDAILTCVSALPLDGNSSVPPAP